MSLIQCPECKKEISDSAEKCPHCGYQLTAEVVDQAKKKTSGKTIGCLILIAFIIFLVIYGSIGDDSENGTAGWKEDKIAAYVMAKQFVEDRLVSPGSADFSSYSEANVIVLGEREYRVAGYVDSQNKFGAMLRSNYICTLRENEDDTWTCTDLSIE